MEKLFAQVLRKPVFLRPIISVRFSKEKIKPLRDNKQPEWQHSSGGSSLTKRKINKRTLDLLKGNEASTSVEKDA